MNEQTKLRCERLSYALNRDAYKQQLAKNKNRRLKHFVPCNKAVMVLKKMSEGANLGVAIMWANSTLCNCHNSLTEDDLYNLATTPNSEFYGDRIERKVDRENR